MYIFLIFWLVFILIFLIWGFFTAPKLERTKKQNFSNKTKIDIDEFVAEIEREQELKKTAKKREQELKKLSKKEKTQQRNKAKINIDEFVAEIEREQKLKKLSKKEGIDTIVKRYYNVLNKKYEMMVYTDDYGMVQDADWKKELQYFLENVFPRQPEALFCKPTVEKIERCFLKLKKRDSASPEISVKNPLDFEARCCQILQSLGYQAHTTKKSGDQGVDVIATKDNLTIVFQCKLYHSPVGNKAVQEVTAGKTYYKADYAAVVTNNAYTKSARQLANNCNVLLLHISELEHIDELIDSSKSIAEKTINGKKK